MPFALADNLVRTRLHPRPIQAELPAWLTTGGSRETARAAGRAGAGLLTHLLGQSLADLRGLVEAYRQAFEPSPAHTSPHVTLMLHTYVLPDSGRARAVDLPGFRRHLKKALALQMRSLARSEMGVDPDSLTADDLALIVERAAYRYLDGAPLIGDVDECFEVVGRVTECGIDEISCLVDFIDGAGRVRSALDNLRLLMDRAAAAAPPA